MDEGDLRAEVTGNPISRSRDASLIDWLIYSRLTSFIPTGYVDYKHIPICVVERMSQRKTDGL
jgi:hypothetical protein